MERARAVPVNEWRRQAACRDKPIEWFYPVERHEVAYALGRAICAECPVAEPCRAFALRVDEDGVPERFGLWGGTTPNMRAQESARRWASTLCLHCGQALGARGNRRGLARYCNAEACQKVSHQEANRRWQQGRRAVGE